MYGEERKWTTLQGWPSSFTKRKLFRLVTLGAAVCISLATFVLLRKSRIHRGAVLILRGGHHPYVYRTLPTLPSGGRRTNRSCPNKHDHHVTNALELSDQFIARKLLACAECSQTIAYEDESMFARTPLNDLWAYSAFLVTRDDVWHVDIIAFVPTDERKLSEIQRKTVCYIDLKTFIHSTPITFTVVPEHKLRSYSYGTAFVSCRYPSRERFDAVRVALATIGTKTKLRWLKVQNPNPTAERNNRKVRLTLCLGPLYDGYKQLSRIVEFFAYYSVMGVENYRVYINDVSREGVALLELIKNRANVSISFHLWNVNVMSTPVANHGQVAAIQDCIYRSKASSEYTVHVDIDEYLVPSDNETLSEVITRFQNAIGKEKLASLVAANWFFCFEYPASQSALSERPLLVSRALTTRERTPWDYEIRSKYIASASAVIVGGVHYVIQAANGTQNVHVPVRTLAVNHYRRCCGLVNEKAQQALVPDEPDRPDVLKDFTIYLYSRRVLSSPVMNIIEKLP